MKRTLFALLTALAVLPAMAEPLNPADWKTGAPDGVYTFNENGTLTATGNSGANELYYTPTAHLMQNGSSLAITLQFDNTAFLDDVQTELSICFHNDNSEYNGRDYLYKVNVMNNTKLNIYGTNHDQYHELTGDTTTITFLYTIKDDLLYCDYTINGTTKTELTQGVAVNTNLHWRPSFLISHTDTNTFTVTDVTFIPVPEPATASLSLLALCGWAARRRRR